MNTLKKIILTLLILLQAGLLYITPLNRILFSISSYHRKYFDLFLILILVFLGVLSKKHSTEKRNFKKISYAFLVVVLISLFVSSIIYDQSLKISFVNSHYYFMILLYVLWPYIFDENNLFSFFIKMFITVSTILSILLIFQILLLRYNSIFLNFDATSLTLDYKTIGGIPRIAIPADFISFGILLNIFELVHKNTKVIFLNVISILISLIYIILISQTRAYMILDVIIVVYGMLILLTGGKKSGLIIGGATVFGLLIFNINAIIDKLGFFTGLRSDSTQKRFEEMSYYLSHFKDNVLLGLGFPDDSAHYVLNHGSLLIGQSSYYLDDVGMIGFISVFGIVGIVIALIFIIKLIKLLIKTKYDNMLILISIYIAITSITLFMLNSQRIFYFSVLLILADKVIDNYKLERNT